MRRKNYSKPEVLSVNISLEMVIAASVPITPEPGMPATNERRLGSEEIGWTKDRWFE